MKIEPLRSYKPKDFALLTPGNKCLYVETKWGKQLFTGKRDVDSALNKLSGFTCYVSSGLERLKNTTSAREWVLTTWRGKGVKMKHVPTGLSVTSLRSCLEGSDDPFRDLNETLTWLRQYGIPPASISSMSWKLLRASLSGTVTVGFDPSISEAAFFGGRQECPKPDVYKNMKSLDIRSAYPSAMSSREIALSLRKVDATTNLDPTQSGMARAKVYVPKSLQHPPLPVRLAEDAIQFQWGHLEGTWSWVELDAAKKLGCDVEVTECWAPGRTQDLFSTWWEMAQEGRSLPHGAARMAKAIANSTWGQFAMRGNDRTEIAWADDKGNEEYETSLPVRGLPHKYALHVAVEVTARVRTQTLMEGLYGVGGAVHVDTDGLIVPMSVKNPENFGSNFGQWQIKENMRTLELRAPQLYRFQREKEDYIAWNYVASGMNGEMARRTFEQNDIGSSIAYLEMTDKCLPPASADDEMMMDAIHREALKFGVKI
jgi:hypothetical protein